MDNTQGKNKIFIYLLVIFFAVFVGTSIFLIINNRKPLVGKEVVPTTTISSTVPTVKPTEGSLSLRMSGGEGNSLTVNKEITIELVADSNEKEIVGYDLVLPYDSSSFDFVKATSDLADFKIYSYEKDSYLSFLATKTLGSKTSSVFAQTKIASFSFKPKKAGRYVFSLKSLMSKDKTDLVTNSSEVLNPKLNDLEINVL